MKNKFLNKIGDIELLVILLFAANFIKYSLFPPSSALLEYHTVFNKEGF